MLRTQKTTSTLICIIIFFCGALLGIFLFNISDFKIEKDINLVNFASLIVTIWLGIYIARTLQMRVTADRVEKEIIIKKLSEILIDYNAIYEYFQDTSNSKTTSFSKLVSLFDKSGNKIGNMINIISHCKLSSRVQEKLDDIILKEREFRHASTNCIVKNDNFIYMDKNNNEIYNSFISLNICIDLLILTVNRS